MNVLFLGGIIILCVVSVYFSLLTVGGSVAAFFTGSLIYLSFGGKGLLILGLFFLSSSFLTKWKKEKKSDSSDLTNEEKKGRSLGQVFANGGVGLLSALGQFILPDPIWLYLYAGAMSTATADTWASEIGVLSKSRPFHIKEWRQVDPGLSGAVSILGTIAAILGATFIGASTYLLFPVHSLLTIIVVLIGGFLGNLADTLFGAYFEEKYVCTVCRKETESYVHCNERTKRVFGHPLFTNNMVNFLATLTGSVITGGLYVWIMR